MSQKHFFFAIVILSVLGFASASAEPISIEYGKDYDRELLGIFPNGTALYQFTTTPEKIVNFTISGIPFYSHYKITEDSSFVKLETMNSGSIVFDKTACTYNMHPNGFVGMNNPSPVKGIGWTVKGKAAASSTWSNVNSVNNAACTVTVEKTASTVKIIGQKSNTVGTFQIVLDYKPGQGIKETMRAYNNNPAWTNHNIGFVERFEVPQFVTMGDTTHNLANQNNTILDRTWIINHKAQLMNLGGKVFYDFGIGFANLNDITIQWIGGKAYLNLNYLYPNGIVPYQTWFEVDPTFGPAAGTFSMPQKTAGSTACATAYSFRAAGTDFLTQRVDTGDAVNGCIASVTQWDITAIPDTAIITNSSFIYQINLSTNTGAMTCIINQVTHNVNAADAETLWNDAMNTANGSSYVTGDTRCRTGSSTVNYDLGATADTDIQNSLSLNRFAAGARFTDMVPTATNIYVSLTTTPQLGVTYLTSLAAPTNLVCTGLPYAVSCTWTASSPGSGVTGYWLSTSLTNASHSFANFTLTANTTSGTVPYLGLARSYYVQANATNSGLVNSTSSNHYLVTTDSKPNAPQHVYITQKSATSVKINWLNETNNGGDTVFGFRIDYCYHFCTAWTNLVNKTATLNYNQTGILGSYAFVKYRIAAWNGVGLGTYTANYTNGPDPVNDLTDVYLLDTEAGLDWSTPALNGLMLSGYNINYTTPWGNPRTAIVNNTGNAATLYGVTGLTQGTDYCFRIGVITVNVTNPEGNILCVTTTTFSAGNFTIGFINFNATNTAQPDIRFTRTDVNSTNTIIEIDYTPTLTLNCDLQYQFAQTNRTYYNVSSVFVAGQKQSSFQFLNGEGEIITIYCWDAATNTTGRYQLTQNDFALLEQIANFRNGTYGTMGLIGVLDLVTFAVILISMIGFNRLNDAVGIIFSLVVVFVAAYFEIISDPVLIIPMIALIALLAVINTRKD